MSPVTKTQKLRSEKNFTYLLIVLYGGGIIAHNSPLLYSFTQSITDPLLFFTNAAVLFFAYQQSKDSRLIIACVLAAIVTFFIEVAGVATGQIFGEYAYGQTMKWQAWGVPFVIGFNWIMLILAGLDIITKHLKALYPPLFAALLVVGFDYIMEPVAIKLDYWQWANNSIPLQNYIAWGIIAFLIATIFHHTQLTTDSKILRTYFLIQLIFFLLLRFSL